MAKNFGEAMKAVQEAMEAERQVEDQPTGKGFAWLAVRLAQQARAKRSTANALEVASSCAFDEAAK